MLKLHKLAYNGLTGDHHVAFCFTFLYSFPYLVAYITPWVRPDSPVARTTEHSLHCFSNRSALE